MIRFSFLLAGLLAIGLAGCQTSNDAPAAQVELLAGTSTPIPLTAAALPSGVSHGWQYQTASGQQGWIFDVPAKSKSTSFTVRVRLAEKKIVSLHVVQYGSLFGRKATKPPFTDRFVGRTQSTLPVDAITGATNTSAAVNKAAAKALAATPATSS